MMGTYNAATKIQLHANYANATIPASPHAILFANCQPGNNKSMRISCHVHDMEARAQNVLRQTTVAVLAINFPIPLGTHRY